MNIKKHFFNLFILIMIVILILVFESIQVYASGDITEEYRYIVFYQERILGYNNSNFTELILEKGSRQGDGGYTYECFVIREVDTDYVILYDDTMNDGVLSFPASWNCLNIKVLIGDDLFCLYDSDYNCIFNPITNQVLVEDVNLENFNQMMLNPTSLELLGNVVSSYSISSSFYFSNLRNNMGINDNGSCTYVALSSVLGYYDIFYNDNIIDNNFDDKVFMLNGTTNNSYNALNCNDSPGVSDDFHDFIIEEIGIKEKGYHEDCYSYRLTRDQGAEVMRSYLNNYTSFGSNDFSITLLNSENTIIQKLNNDIPVILGYESWGYDVEVFSENYLFNLFNYNHMVIAYGYEILDDGTVYYRCNLGWQGLDDTSDVYVKSYNSIVGFCLEFNNISHICSTLYVNEISSVDHQSFCPTCGNLTNNELDFHCRSESYENTTYLNVGKKIFLNINVDCPIQYKIKASSTNEVLLKIYNDDMTLLDIGTPLEINNVTHIVSSYPLLTKGKYYIEIYFNLNTISGNVSYEISPYTSIVNYISSNIEEDALTHLHDNKNEFVISSSEEGLYLLSLSAKVNNESINPHASFVVKDIYGNTVQKVNITGHNHLAYSAQNANNIMFYVNAWCNYTIYLDVADIEYQELKLCINKVDDFVEYSMNNNDYYYENDGISIGDAAYIYNLERIGTYNININYNGDQLNNMLFVFYEDNGNGNYSYKNSYEINTSNNSIIFTEIVSNSKKLLLCVFDSEGLGNLQIYISKYHSTSFSIITDPSVSTAGSEVQLNGGLLGGNTITIGFTRICYLGNDAPDNRSRNLYYNWYSINNDVVKVSSFGTITAVGIGTTTIQCVYKADPSIVASLQITVIEYNGTEDIFLNYGMDCRTGGTSSGTEVTSGLGSIIVVSENPEVTIHTNKTRLICLGIDSPSTSIQDFNWSSNLTNIATVSSYGTITGINQGSVTITGIYKYNYYYKVVIEIDVI